MGLTMILIFGILTGARYLRIMFADSIPKWSTWTVLLVYNGFWAALIVADRIAGPFSVPSVLVPVAVVGGNAALVTLFGLPPGLRRTPKPKPEPIDPSREKIVFEARKKRHKKRK